MTYEIEHRGEPWYLFGSRLKLNNGELGYRYFFSKKEKGRMHWDSIDELPSGWEVSKKGMMPMLRKVKPKE